MVAWVQDGRLKCQNLRRSSAIWSFSWSPVQQDESVGGPADTVKEVLGVDFSMHVSWLLGSKMDAERVSIWTSGARSGASRGHQSIRPLVLCRNAPRPQSCVFSVHVGFFFCIEDGPCSRPHAPAGVVTTNLFWPTRGVPAIWCSRLLGGCPKGVPQRGVP